MKNKYAILKSIVSGVAFTVPAFVLTAYAEPGDAKITPITTNMTAPTPSEVENSSPGEASPVEETLSPKDILPNVNLEQPIEIKTLEPANVAFEESKLEEKLSPFLKTFFERNFISLSVTRHYISEFVPLSKGDTQLKKIRLPGFENHVWVPEKFHKSMGFVERRKAANTIVVVVWEPVEKNYIESLKRDLGFQIPELNFEHDDVLKIVSVGTHTSSPALTTKEEVLEEAALEAQADELKVTQKLLEAREAFFQNDLSRALAAVNEAVEMDPSSPRGYEMQGSIYFTLNWHKKALEKWEMALSLDPSNVKLKTYIDRLKRGL